MYSAVALFCDDIREEAAGTHTIVGIYPDNITLPSIPFTFPKLVLYIRINFPVSAPPQSVSIRLTQAKPPEAPLTTLGADIIEKATRESMEKGATNAGLISKAFMAPFQIERAGRIDVRVKIGEQEEFVCGTLNVQGPVAV